MNFKKKIVLIVAVLMSMLMLVACGGEKKATETAAVRDTLVVGNGADAKSLDPHASNDNPSSRVTAQIYDRLAEFDENSVPQPSLAESWEQPDNLTTIVHLRKGVKFHNGEELKASDVKFTFERMFNSPQVNHIVEAIDKVEVIDDYTVKFTTKEPFAPLLNHLAHNATAILNEKAVTTAGDTYGQNPVGTGPYKFVSWASGDRITLEAFPEYFKGETPVKNLIFRSIVEETNRTIGLETGELDIVYDILGMDKNRLKDDPKYNYIEEPGVSMTYIGFNLKKAPFDNPKVREAISYAINQQPIIETAFVGGAVAADSIIGPRLFAYYPVEKYEYNPEKAKELLKEAGYENGFKTKIWINDNNIRRDIAVIVQDQLKQIGIDMAVETLEWGAYLDGTARGDHEMFILGWGTVTRDPDYGISALVSTETQGGAGNRSFYSNPKVDELLKAGRAELDIEKRKAIYKEVQEIIRKDLPMYMVSYPTYNVVTKKDVKNFKFELSTAHRLYGIKIEN
ncbi:MULTISPECIES: glutathione ABC transporter substrate-binding protein [Fusobacterium]|uniref:glutathione ABC transporter substrate-binding protein n=1 Tax=Fusobacterium TaxID=848 RepID=UPI0025C49749|nr:glutathione ABC transporter substrate-binding protein [Fusobacterium sp.]MCI5725478.1 glutathione ABC transporter substrate-binding protein [Fusobacterium sp.]MDY5305221.1 glutathione ABC transporter substrate-binding protein [Fusobacterium gastrosuis]